MWAIIVDDGSGGSKIDTIIDDTEESIGSKTKKFNMIGIPNQIILGKKSTEREIEFLQSDKQIKTLELNKVIDIIRKDLTN